ncbi:MAG TPA: DUF2264 domain-containing protein [Acidimicrobiia bacterium]|jgi:hypothetical protein|nr:DUF2264 domain-containing protein [Acidimicrobiia bacterium]
MAPVGDAWANPLAGNPLVTRHDVERAVVDLVEPIVAHLSPGSACARLGTFGAHFAPRVAELEGYARPLWGIVPLVAGGGTFAHWERWVEGLAHGTDPDSTEYWGPCIEDVDQRMVEMAAIGFALTFAPEHLWDPLTGRQRDHVVEWLRGIERCEPARNNWQFFRLLVQLGFERIEIDVERDAQARSVELIDSFAIDDGWYTDGTGGNIDWYVPFAFHTYGLVMAASGLGDRDAAARYVERARAFAPQFRHWFAADGGALPFGRSLTYRMAQGSFWGALALADVDALEWAEVRGLALRQLRWWSALPISDRDGVLSVGYGYDNRRMAESYNSAGSPYWCMKAFTMLAAPADHPFWTVEEVGPPAPGTVSLRTAGMVLGRADDQVVGLFAQQPGWSFVEQADAKYLKFAYSSRFGFSGDFTMYGFGATDSMLAITDPSTGARKVREGVALSEVDDGVALTRWFPLPGVRVDTALAGGAPWHVRVHRIETDRELVLTETGFALAWEPEGFAAPPLADAQGGVATMTTAAGATTVVDRTQRGAPTRRGELVALSPNANVMHPHTVVPALGVTVPAGCHLLACAVGASREASRVAGEVAPPVDAALLERLDAFSVREVPS